MLTKFEKDGRESGKTVYRVTTRRQNRRVAVARIRYFDKPSLVGTYYENDPHWVLIHFTGRIDRYDTLSEAKDEAIKTYG